MSAPVPTVNFLALQPELLRRMLYEVIGIIDVLATRPLAVGAARGEKRCRIAAAPLAVALHAHRRRHKHDLAVPPVPGGERREVARQSWIFPRERRA